MKFTKYNWFKNQCFSSTSKTKFEIAFKLHWVAGEVCRSGRVDDGGLLSSGFDWWR